jgi:short-subunit dehydrogenase
VIYCIKALLPLLKVSSSGYIINIGSLLSKVSYAQTSIYSATKFALNGFTEGFRYEMKKNNIKVGFFMPGPMNTSFHDDWK